MPTPLSRIGLVAAPAVAFVLWLLPLSLEPRAHRLAAIFAGVVILWVTEAVPPAVAALLVGPALVAFGVADAEHAFSPYADPLLFLFVGGFFIAQAMMLHGLDRRIASSLATLRFVRSPRAALMGTAVLVSAWISNTATTAILLPILLGMVDRSSLDAGRRHAIGGSVLAVAYACSLGGMATPVGSPPNLITMRFIAEHAKVSFGFLDWVAVGLPAAVLMTAACFLLLSKLAPDTHSPHDQAPRNAAPWTRGETVTAIAFALAVMGWVIPGLADAAGAAWGKDINKHLSGPVVALLACVPLFVVRDRSQGAPVLPWREATKIDWGTILLFGGGISLGNQLFDTGLAQLLGRGCLEITGVTNLWALTALVMVIALFLTELCSNTATATMLAPLAIAMAKELGVSPIPPALGVGLAASCGFMLPVSTGPNALAYATGYAPVRMMARTGLALDLICLALGFGVVWMVCSAMGWS